MTISRDARFWDRTARKYAAGAIGDQAGYERTLARTSAFLRLDDRVLELGCGTGTTALRLARDVGAYLATDISSRMIAIAEEKHAATPVATLAFRTAVAEEITPEPALFNAVLGFNYLHLVRDLSGTLAHIRSLLAPEGLLISKTPCVGDMNPLIKLALPLMRMIGKAPYAGVFRATELTEIIKGAGFEITAIEDHATKRGEHRPYIVARKAVSPQGKY
jgi:ubiquinone/menaquinone biosynthesis C-methylase UbiE